MQNQMTKTPRQENKKITQKKFSAQNALLFVRLKVVKYLLSQIITVFIKKALLLIAS